MFTIVRPDKEYEYWEILLENTEKVVATIEMYTGFKTTKKQLKVKDKVIADVKNQNEALGVLKKFFMKNNEEIIRQKLILIAVNKDLDKVSSDNSKEALQREIKRIEEHIKNLEQYNLI